MIPPSIPTRLKEAGHPSTRPSPTVLDSSPVFRDRVRVEDVVLNPPPTPPARRGLYAFAIAAAALLISRNFLALDPALAFGLACAALIIAALTRGHLCRAALCLALALIAAGMWSARIVHRAENDLAIMLAASAANSPATPTPAPPRSELNETDNANTPAQSGDTADTTEPAEPDEPDEPQTPQGRLVTITGLILDDPVQSARPLAWSDTNFNPPPLTRFALASRFIAPVATTNTLGEPCSGRVYVSIRGSHTNTPRPRAGDLITITGVLNPLNPPTNPGQPDLRPVLAQSNIAATLWVESWQLVRSTSAMSSAPSQTSTPPAPSTTSPVAPSPLTPLATSTSSSAPPSDLILSAWSRVTSTVRRGVADALPWSRPDAPAARYDRAGSIAPTDADHQAHAMLGALLLGTNEPDLRPISDSFTRLGLIHALSISGFHLAVLAGTVFVLIRITGERGRLAHILAILAVVLYTIAVPANAPVLRSMFMISVVLAARISGRRYDSINLLAWVAVALLLIRPMDLWDVGFQLSFGVTGAILWLTNPVQQALTTAPIAGVIRSPIQNFGIALKHRFMQALSVSLLAWLVSAPAIIYHTGVLSPLAVLTSLIVLPFISLALVSGYITLILGLFIVLVSMISSSLPSALGLRFITDFAASITDHLASFILWMTQRFDQLPGSAWHWPSVPALWAIAATLVITLILRRPSRIRGLTGLALLAITLWTITLLATAGRLDPSLALRIDELDTNGGRCALIRSGDQSLLIDCGSASSIINANAGLIVPRAVRTLGAWRVPTLILTAPTARSAGGARAIIDRLGIRDVLITPRFAAVARGRPSSEAARLLAHLRDNAINIRTISATDELRLTHAIIRFEHDDTADLIPHVLAITPSGELELPLQPASTPRSRHTQPRAWHWATATVNGDIQHGHAAP